MRKFERGDIVEYIGGYKPCVGYFAVVLGPVEGTDRWQRKWIPTLCGDAMPAPKCGEYAHHLRLIVHVDDFEEWS